MLHHFSADAPYFTADELARLERNPPRSAQDALDRLSKLLPLLGDEVVPVWSSPPLPFHPVALVSFSDKNDTALVAVVCENGLLAVTRGDAGRSWTYLQIPHVWPRGGHIQGLWASNALRPFGHWTELLVLMRPASDRAKEAGPPKLFRAVVRTEGKKVHLEPAFEEGSGGETASAWHAFDLPAGYGWLARGRVFCGGGTDPFDPHLDRPPSDWIETASSSGSALIGWGREHRVWVEGGNQVRSGLEDRSYDLGHPLVGLTTLQARPARVIVATDRRRLVALEQREGEWRAAWEQPVRHRITSLDHAAGSASIWPDLFVATSIHTVMRFRYYGSSSLGTRWEEAVAELRKQAGFSTPDDGLTWVDSLKGSGSKDSMETEAQQTTALYLLVDCVLRDSAALGNDAVRSRAVSFLLRERRSAVQQPAAERLLQALKRWEDATEDRHVPVFVNECYEQLPYVLQEVFDSHIRSVKETHRQALAETAPESYGELLENAENVLAFYEPDPSLRRAGLRRAGTEVLRATQELVTAGFCNGPEENVRLLIPAPSAPQEKGQPRFLTLGRSLFSYRLDEHERRIDVEGSQLIRTFDPPFTPAFAFNLKASGRWFLIIGARQGRLISIPWQSIVLGKDADADTCASSGELSAACILADGEDPERLLVACSSAEGNEIQEVTLGPDGRFLLGEALPTGLRQIQTLAAFADGPGNRLRLFAGELGDIVLLEREDGTGWVEHGRRHLGSSVTLVAAGKEPSRRLICGTRNGHLFAIDVLDDSSPWQRIAWIQHIPHGVIQAIPGYAGSGKVAVVGGQGHLHLVDLETQSHLRHSLPDPAEAAVLLRSDGPPDYLVVVGASGTLTVLQATTKPSRSDRLQVALKLVRQEPSDPDDVDGLHETEELGWCLRRLDRGEPAESVYTSVRDSRAVRRAALRLAEALELGSDETWRALVEQVEVEDLSLLLQLRGHQNGKTKRRSRRHDLVPAVRERLLSAVTDRRPSRVSYGELDPRVMLLYELLRCVSRDRDQAALLKMEELRKLPLDHERADWTSYLVAELLIGDIGSRIDESRRLLEPLLDKLSQLPLSVTLAASTLVSGSEETRDLEAVLRDLVSLGHAFGREARPIEVSTALDSLATNLAPWLGEEGAIALFAQLIQLLHRNAKGDFERFLSLLIEAKKLAPDSVVQRLLLQLLARCIDQAPPETGASLAAWKSWLQQARRRAEAVERMREENLVEVERIANPSEGWARVFERLGARALELWQQQLQERLQRLHGEVRLDLRVLSEARRTPSSLQLALAIAADALRPLDEVRCTLSFEGPGKLVDLHGEPLVVERQLGSFEPARGEEPELVTVEGLVEPGCSEISVHIRMQWQRGGERDEVRRLPLTEARPSSHGHRVALPEILPSWARAVQERVDGATGRALFVVLDEELGREQLVDLVVKPGARVLDLDTALAEVGPGRTYPRLFDRNNVLAALREEPIPHDGDPLLLALEPGRRLVLRCDDFWDRILTLPQLGALAEELLGFLISAKHQGVAEIVFFVSSTLGRRLRSRIPRHCILDAHRLRVTEESSAEEGLPGFEEAVAWLASEVTGLNEESAQLTLQAFHGDLRLLSHARNTWKRKYFMGGGLGGEIATLLQSEEARTSYLQDLELLPPSAIHLLLLGAVSKTRLPFEQVRKGMVSTEDLRASRGIGKKTTRTGALILRAGERIDARALGALRSDAGARQRQVTVRGFSLGGGVEYPSAYTGLVQLLDEKLVERATRELADLGAAEDHGGVVRTLPPYSRVIQAQGQRSPSENFAFLTGGESLFEDVPLARFHGIPSGVLRELLPKTTDHWLGILHGASAAWDNLAHGRKVSETQLVQTFQDLTNYRAMILVRPENTPQEEWARLVGDGDYLFGLGDSPEPTSFPYYLLVLSPRSGRRVPPRRLLEKIERSTNRNQAPESGPTTRRHRSLFVLRSKGSGAADPQDPPWIDFTDGDLRDVLLRPDPHKAFWAHVRARTQLTSLAPFQREGALPPGSPIFAGRRREVDFIFENASKKSILIVGARQIGKTSLLNKVRYELGRGGDVALIHLDLQGRGKAKELRGPLRDRCTKLGVRAPKTAAARDLVDLLIKDLSARGKTPVFLLNEIDYLLQEDLGFLATLRGLHDGGRARFIMTGYFQAAASTGRDRSPFYHWTSSPDGRPYIVLAELSDEAAIDIIEFLERPPLEISWRGNEKEKGIQEILQRSYRIPHLVQSLCLGLVERLEETRRTELRASDVISVARDPRYSAWEFVNKVDLGELAEIHPSDKGRYFVELLLLIAAQARYFEGSPPAIERKIDERDPRSLSFGATDLRDWYPKVVNRLLRGSERKEAEKLLDQVDLESLLKRLSLTLLLSWDLEADRYYFQSHLFPLEVRRRLHPGESIDDWILDRTLKLYLFFEPDATEATAEMEAG